MGLKTLKYSWKTLVAVVVVMVIASIMIDFIRILTYKTYPMHPPGEIRLLEDRIYFDLMNGAGNVDWDDLKGTLDYIDGQYDCSDFRFVNLIRIIYQFDEVIPQSVKSDIKNTVSHFRYWWDEPGDNSMCYWSENHQILFASAEYLIGQKYQDMVFPGSGLTGRQHMDKAGKRILDWLEMRWKFGFTEFYSEVYYKEDIGAMINLIDFAEDEEIVKKTKIIMDLLLYDVAAQNCKLMFVSVSGRAYEKNRKGGPGMDLGGLTRFFWAGGEQKPGMVYGLMVTKNYVLPPVLSEIAVDTVMRVVKQHNGLDIKELKEKGYYGTDDRSMMMQWGMEAFTNPEVIRHSLSFIRTHHMFSNAFLKDFKYLDFTVLRLLQLEPVISEILDPQTNGVAIQTGNTYTCRTREYSIYAVQDYHPGKYGDQQHVSGMNIGNAFSIFHMHPALEKGVQNQSPNYWVGYGHLPQVAQYQNVNLAIYFIPAEKGWMEEALPGYTHAYFPQEKFDTVSISENYAFGKKGDVYCAFIGKNSLSFRPKTTDDLIQQGKRTFWITQAGSKEEYRSFNDFCREITANDLEFDSTNLQLHYTSRGKQYDLRFDGDFRLNGMPVNTRYRRYESPYVSTQNAAESLTIHAGGKSLYLDFYKMVREF